MDKWRHKYPKNQGFEHTLSWSGNLETDVCVCNPVVETESKIVLHKPVK